MKNAPQTKSVRVSKSTSTVSKGRTSGSGVVLKKSTKSSPRVAATTLTPRRTNTREVGSRVSAGSRTTVRRTRTKTPLARFRSQGKRTLRDILLSKMLQRASKVFVVVGIITSCLYGGYHFVSSTFASDVVISKSEIVARASRHVTLPSGEPDDVVRVQNAENLRKQNAFYSKVNEGDYVIMYPSVAVIYDLKRDTVVAVKSTDQ